jgi:hypothetical protein
MPLTYLDQNALLGLGFKAQKPEFRTSLDSAIRSGSVKIVVSSWHLIETANTANVNSATRLADFIDSLDPAWIFERRDLQKLDVQEDFYRFLRIDYENQPRVTSRSAVIAAVNNARDSPRFDIPSRDFVRQWIDHPAQLRTLKASYERNVDDLFRLREIVKTGLLTDEVRRRAEEILVKLSLPKTTPAGLEIGRELKADYTLQAKISSMPTMAIEAAISENEWSDRAVGEVGRNTLIDKFHLISALPYVDEIVSTDSFFHAIYPVAQRTGHVRAALLKNDEFIGRFY